MKAIKGGAVGVSGYMGAGKSTVADRLSAGGAMVIDVDSVAKQLMCRDDEIRMKIARTFGSDIVGDAAIDFARLGGRAYVTLDTIEQLNRIVHPLLLHELARRREACEGHACIFDAALIPYWHIESWFDTCIWVEASADVRFRRLEKKLSLDTDALKKRMDLQQALFEKPRGAPWREVRNEGPLSDLESRLNSRDLAPVRNVLHP
jgi:dephospho-CoA kinase